MTFRRGLRWAMVATVAAVGFSGLAPIPRAGAGPLASVSTAPSAALNSLWNSYGDQGGHWTGGDSTASVPLPDGRVAWLFSDTYLGTVNPDHSRPAGSPLVHNTLVVQANGQLVQTLHGGTASAPLSLVETPGSPLEYWVADGTVEGGALKVFYNLYEKVGGGSLDVIMRGTAVATFSLPGLALTGVQTLPLGSTVAWANAVVEDGAYTYVYGSEHTTPGGIVFLHVARVPAGGLGGAWQFWNGSGWSDDEADSERLISGVGTAFSVTKVGTEYVLVTADSNMLFSPVIVAYTARTPTGPFGEPRELYQPPELAAGAGKPIIAYDARVHPEQGSAGTLVVSYNVNSLDAQDTIDDVRIYRPRFIDVTWPLPTPDPATLPGEPRNLAVSPSNDGTAQLSWTAPAGTGLTYHLWQKDVTAGQSYFGRFPGNYSTTSAGAAFLTEGHTYQWRVTAVNAAGDGRPSNTVEAAIRVVPPASPANLRAAPDAIGQIQLAWDAVPGNVVLTAFQRDVTAGETEFRPVPILTPGARTTTVQSLQKDHEYEFKVTARNGGGESAPSNLVRATSHWDLPPTPTGLTATPRSDGDITLSWTAPGTGLWYWIYQRDVTAGDTDFTKNGIPITTGTTHQAGYLTQDHEYEFKVASINQGGDSAPTAPVRATSHADPPPTPTGLTATARPDGSIALAWTAPAPNLWYWIYHRDVTAGDTTFSEKPYLVTTGTAHTVTLLTQDHVYEFKVASLSQSGVSPSTTAVRATAHFARPAAPTALTAQAGDGQVALSWSAPAPAAGVWYWVYLRNVTRGETNFTQVIYPVATGTSFTGGYLSNGDIYEFKVSAFNQGGESEPSNRVQARPLPLAPGPPTNLTATAAHDGTIALSWTAPGPNLFYSVYMRDVTAGQTFQKLAIPTTATSFTAGWLTNDHAYAFKVAGTNLAGDGPASNVAQATAHYERPSAPTNLRGATSASGTITLNWDAPGPNLYYWVYYRDVTAGQTAFTKLTIPSDRTEASPGLLANNHLYEFQVTAENAGGEGPASNAIQVMAHSVLPATPTNLRAVAGSGEVALSWTPSTTPDVWYWIYQRDVTTGQSWQQSGLVDPSANGTRFTATWLTNGHTYEFRVTSTYWAGDSASSNIASATPRYPRPAAPTNLAATPQPNQVRLTWTASSTPNVYYWIEYRDADAGEGWQRIGIPTGATSFTYPGLKPHNYQFRVVTNGVGGDSDPSNLATAKPQPPLAPSSLTATAGVAQVSLSWAASPTPSSWYWIEYRDTSIGQSWQRVGYPTANTSFTLTVLKGVRYEFRIRATAMSGDSVPSPIAAATPLRPAPPRNLTAAAGDTQVRLNWTPSTSPNVSYWVEYRDATVNQAWQRMIYPTTGTSATPGYLRNGHTYEFRIISVGPSGESGSSNVVSARPLPPAPAKPNLSVFALPIHGVIRLEWFASYTNGLYYWIQWEMPDGQWWTYPIRPIIAFPDSPAHYAEIPVSQLFEFSTYNFRILAVNEAGQVSSNTRLVTAWPSTGTMYYRFTTPGRDNLRYFQSAKWNGYWDIYGFDWSDNGCSSPLGDSPSGVSFNNACVRHDFAYRNHRLVGLNDEVWRARADYTLLDDMRNACYDELWGPLEWPCLTTAGAYYFAVRQWGRPYW